MGIQCFSSGPYYNPCDFYYHPEPTSPYQSDEDDDEFSPLQIDGHKIQRTLSSDAQPTLIVEDETLASLEEAIRLLPRPHSNQTEELETWVRIVNFFNGNKGADYIHDPEQFKLNYQNCLQRNETNLLTSPAFLSVDYTSSLDEISPPRLEENKLIFYIEKQKIPYRIIVSFQNNQTPCLCEESLVKPYQPN